MKSNAEMTEQIDRLIAYSVEKGLDQDMLDALVEPLRSAISTYLSATGYSDQVRVCIKALAHGLIRTQITYKGASATGYSGAPAYFDDVTGMFNAVDNLIFVSDDTFYESVNTVTETPPAGSTSTEPRVYYQSDLVDNWIESYTAAPADILSKLTAISSYANTIGLGNDLENIFEPKVIESVPERSGIAKQIYIDKHYKELIDFKELGLYVPTYLR